MKLKSIVWQLTVAGVSGLLLISCGQRPSTHAPVSNRTNAPAANGTNPQIFQVKGVIKEVYPERKKVKIHHEDIPNYMEAMTMMLDVREAKELEGLKPGDAVSFRMLVTDDDGWIDQLQKLSEPRTPLPATPGLRRVRDVEPLAVGDKMPDYVFTNTAERVVRLSDFRGKAVGLTFIFTRCPFPTFCPRLSTSFAETQQKLKAGALTNWVLLSITIEPEFDTPARLRAYGERYKADPAHWEFLTGDLTDITAIGEQFGLQFWRANPNEPINHNVRTVVIDAAGRIQWVTPENEWKPEGLAEEMTKAAQVKPEG